MNGNEKKLDGASSLPEQIKADIRKKLSSRELKPGDRLPSETRLALFYGVSRMTARQALVELISEGRLTRSRGRGTFVSKKHYPETRTVIVIVPDLANSFYHQLISGLENELTSGGIETVLRSVGENPFEEKRCLERALEDGTAVALIAGEYSGQNASLIRAAHRKLPLAVLDVIPGRAATDIVVSEDRKGGFIATVHLLELGHTEILHLAGPAGDSSAEERARGYREALSEAGRRADGRLMRRTGWHYDEGYYETKKAFGGVSRPAATAIFACNDEVAAGAYRALREAGITIPAEAAIVGYGNLECGRFLEIPLTTVDQSAREMGVQAGRLLAGKINRERRMGETKQVTVGVKLIIRDSCGIKSGTEAKSETKQEGRA